MKEINIKENWLRQKRLSKKMTQEEVSKQSGIERAYYSQIENGYRRPSVNVAKKIAATLDFDWTIFFENDCSDM